MSFKKVNIILYRNSSTTINFHPLIHATLSYCVLTMTQALSLAVVIVSKYNKGHWTLHSSRRRQTIKYRPNK